MNDVRWFGLILALACVGCQAATPDRILRSETRMSDVERPVCERMRDDFAMRPVPSEPGQPTYEASFASRLLRGGGLYFSLSIAPSRDEDDCRTGAEGAICDAAGPSVLTVRTPAGQADYRLVEGETAFVRVQGARLSCQQLTSG